MKLYQPVLFVGLGGTGCNIGAEFERRLRDEICGPDGRRFSANRGRGGMLPYQLPGCVQFVYADMNQAELNRLPNSVVPGPEHVPAVAHTAKYVTGLLPNANSYPELAVHLRLQATPVVDGWLPPWSPEEPTTTPLQMGAGQFPTIGRAALFGTFLAGVAPAVQEIGDAVGRLAGAGSDLHILSDGGLPQGVDVFVAFSVVGGTGAGIFYDYLHLIADTVERSTDLRVRLYPLVLMPSAFDERHGGGRKAELNAARALLDLFRLVDEQNGAQARRELRAAFDRATASQEEVAVSYPGHERIVIHPGRIQTGFLFSRPKGATKEDMYASTVSLMMSLIGTDLSEADRRLGSHPVSFAEKFVNDAADRSAAAENRIGNRGVSTAAVASLSVPVDELSGIVADRLLREAINEMSAPDKRIESNHDDIRDFLTRAGVYPAVQQQPGPHAEPSPVQGAGNVMAALNDRRDALRVGLESLRAHLSREVPQLAAGFHPHQAVTELLGSRHPFRVQRIVFGHPSFEDGVDRGGASGTLQRRRNAPAAPEGFGAVPPEPPQLRDRMLRKVRWNDQEVIDAKNQQNRWYEWQTQVAWANLWNTHARQWQRPLDQVQRELVALTDALTAFAAQDVGDFQTRSAALYKERVGVSYLLPAGSGQMPQFYENVIRELRRQRAEDMDVNSSEAGVLQGLLDEQTWPRVFELSIEDSPGRAVSLLREQVKTKIKEFLRESPPGGQPILPRLHDLLAQAAGLGQGGGAGQPAIDQNYVREFQSELAGMVPLNFSPQGSQPLKVLISYPADHENETIQAYLSNAISLPAGQVPDYRATGAESITVVLTRSSMGVTEVGEVRDVLRRWASALAHPEPTDLLPWRQRTGYDFGYLATREIHRVEILHRLLCALWNGLVTVTGAAESPDRINVTLPGDVTMTLPLEPLHDASSWGSLLREYELWALDDDQLHHAFCRKLMDELPSGLNGKPSQPAELYQSLRKITGQQVTLLEKMVESQPPGHRSRTAQMLGFWKVTLSAALDQEFQRVQSPVVPNLRELERAVGFKAD